MNIFFIIFTTLYYITDPGGRSKPARLLIDMTRREATRQQTTRLKSIDYYR
jgi:hypothetical protein